MDRDKLSILYIEPSIDASYQVLVHLAKRFQRKWFLEIDQLETRTRKNCFRYLILMYPLNAAICTTIGYTLWVEWYYLKTIIWPWGQRSRSHEGHYGAQHTPYGHAPTYQISLTYLKRQKYYGPDKLRWEEAVEAEEKIRLKQYVSLRSKGRHNYLWQPYLLVDRDEMSNLYTGPPIDASYQVSVHLAKRFQRRRCCRNQPIRNMNCLWQPCLLTERDGMNNLNRGPSIDASCQVSDHLAKRFQRRNFLEIDQSERRIPRSGRNEHSI